MSNDYQEGYADGLAGAGLQDRIELAYASFDRDYGDMDEAQKYVAGFELGSLDRKAHAGKGAARMNRNDQIGGDHYASKAVQPWDAMEAWMPREAFIGYLEGNVIKYMARWRDKGGVQDLAKARHYLQKLIEVASAAQTPVR